MTAIRGDSMLLLLPFQVLRRVMDEPAVTGPMLYILTRGPAHIRERLLQPFRNNFLAKNGAARTTVIINLLKVYFAIGVFRRISKALNCLALNGWALTRQGEPFAFSPAKQELVVITGASSGFGYEMVKAFAKVARVVAFDVNDLPPDLETLPGVHFYRLDISDFNKVQEVCCDVRRVHGDPTVLINNAGIANKKSILVTSNEETERLFKINIIAQFALIREFLPGMLRMRKGHVVTIASMASFWVSEGLVDYSCTKTGALYLNDGLRAECLRTYEGGEGICTTSVHPSWYQTGILAGVEEALAKQGIKPRPPVEVADAVVEQVLKARSGRLVVPRKSEMWADIRYYPKWVQDAASGLIWSKNRSRFQAASGMDGESG
ncbi:uncharacterized protein N0V89_004002 [Didymosphaeria variabile]|uniref:NAD(P)-binding protein n=1 Tax=Didymosphaeria variabile TaxID=1932322 RepID=A0A9W9CD18_9PLEO|nr:uncharacterized protein N0V89_004002 [Didymosphaeria variabile]KAJ4355977.1 hypothetical protein N0V89_004002 [Didymosphaeria variabile]